MNKEEYLAALRVELMDLTVEDRNRWLDYYRELMDDALEDGATEGEVIASLGTVEELAARIRENIFDLSVPGEDESGEERSGPVPGREEDGAIVFSIHEAFHSLELENDVGDICLAIASDGLCRVEAVKAENFTCRVEVRGDVLSVRGLRTAGSAARSISWRGLLSGFSFGRNGSITVFLPEGDYHALGVRTMSGDVDLPRGLCFGEGRISTVSGDVTARSAFRALRVESASGDLELEDMALEHLYTHTASGDISLEGVTVQETLRLETASGDIRMGNSICAVLELQTASGDIDAEDVLARDHALIATASGDVEMNGFDTGEARMSTASGDVDISLLRGKRFEAHSRSGDIRLPADLPGGGLFRVNTASGDIRISVER